MTGSVESRREGGVLTITLERTERRNALTTAMITQLAARLDAAREAPGPSLVVLRAAGPDFCAGLDLQEFCRSADDPRACQEIEAERLAGVFRLLLGLPAPTVSVLRGKVLGIGATLAAACDVVLASSSAQIGFPEAHHGFVPAFAAAILNRCVGRRIAFELLATGRLVPAAEARSLGLVSRVIPDEGFDAVVGSCLKALDACPSELLIELKGLLAALDRSGLDYELEVARRAHLRARESVAFREAARRFLTPPPPPPA